MEGDALVRSILNRRLTKCIQQKAHHPIPENCRWCGIGGPYKISFDYGQATKAVVL